MLELRWSADSTRLVFVMLATAERSFGAQARNSDSIAWAPEDRSLTVLADSSLVTYDLSGKVLDSEPTDLQGPLAWIKSE